ncbi:RsmB/NOP family class I SAM-dependent RNA methyltransferase [Exilibacterium tricleocarpae]|uniref:RsmB/NOP family class I SAM-dependent RNA methyltransferase n=1 Tax=Exilibacterium tricleocarpae TaxID=2591008 RepID=A0A545UBI2_9GAMM|nr:RsmB/NOP family class I SAM-dependent RNA methyltransferase [Exilibacterium tricleocarpae]TQV86817.1 RsmB/NOP family class I SAM-dependent RNA methyltransferase [Exilibacterium tricleocarpae]
MSLNQLPDAFVHRLERIIPPAHWETTVAGLQRQLPPCFRVNTLRAAVDQVLGELQQQGIDLASVNWRADSFVVADTQRQALTHSRAFAEGRIYIQNLSSIFTAQALAALPGEEVLDLAAAPGGKTLVLACAMENRGRIAAVESVKSRFFRLKHNIDLHGATLVECYLKDGRQVGRQVPGRFDRVLLDAPCSSEARFYTADPDSYKYWSEKKVKEMQRKQKQLLHSALLALKPGGTLVYSTCSFAPEENEMVLDRQLRKWGDGLTVCDLDTPFANCQPGLTEWNRKSLDPRLSRAVRILPSATMEGFFLCVLRKTAE